MVLFIGGQEHGKRYDLPPNEPVWFFPMRQPMLPMHHEDDQIPRLPEPLMYVRQSLAFHGVDKPVDIFFPKGWDPQWQAKALRDYLEFG